MKIAKDIDAEIEETIKIVRQSIDRLEQLLEERRADNDDDSGEAPWITGGLILPHGSDLKFTYRKKEFSGKVKNGWVVINGLKRKSAKGIVEAVAKKKDGTIPNLNGWTLLWGRLPGESEWQFLNDLRNNTQKHR